MNTDAAVMVVVAFGAVEPDTIRVAVNGVEREVPRGTTVADLCAILGVEHGRVAVERNRDVVPRRTYEQVVLSAGDRLEVVSFVGGGAR